jgi:putative transposase
MARAPRSYLADYRFFHAYARGVDRMAISRDDFDRAAWVALLERAVRRFELTIHTYCLMPNHFHLVVESELNDLSRGMHHLNGVYAQRFNRRHERSGHLFQERFGVRAIGDEAYLYGACAYVLDNPVRAGLCESPDDWPWSAGPS